MKTLILFSLAFMIIPCTFTANSAPAPAPVLDSFGKILRAGARYYVMPAALDGENGGLLLVEDKNNSCPNGIQQSRNDEAGLPVTFTPVNPKKGVIRLSTDVNVKFSGPVGCGESSVWRLKYDKAMKEYALTVGGVEGNNPGPKTLHNWFKIEKTSDGYKLRYCNVRCRDVGIVEDEGGAQRLVLDNEAASFVFFRA